MKFLKSFTPAQINQPCKEGKAKVEISVFEPEDEEIQIMDNGHWVIRKQERIILQQGSEIRSGSDLFQIDDKYAMFYGVKQRKMLK